MTMIGLAEKGILPDQIIRLGIRRQLADRLRQEQRRGAASRTTADLVQFLKQSPVALATDLANAQHYEVPAEFFASVLGPRLKYSCCQYTSPGAALPEAEESMLSLVCQRAELSDGMDVLDLGCGWGSMALWIAQKYPHCRVTALSNSLSQRRFIESRAESLGLSNLRVITANMNVHTGGEAYDRVISVEMFEHMRNYDILFRKIAGWLEPDGKLFAHIFCHATMPYPFEVDGNDDWMAKHFFTGGIMPSALLFAYFARDLVLEDHWQVNGRHYSRTLEAWLKLHDERKTAVMDVFRKTLPEAESRRMFHRWRIFYLACSELFGWAGGNHWFVGHYLWSKRG